MNLIFDFSQIHKQKRAPLFGSIFQSYDLGFFLRGTALLFHEILIDGVRSFLRWLVCRGSVSLAYFYDIVHVLQASQAVADCACGIAVKVLQLIYIQFCLVVKGSHAAPKQGALVGYREGPFSFHGGQIDRRAWAMELMGLVGVGSSASADDLDGAAIASDGLR